MNCEWEKHGEKFKCKNCGAITVKARRKNCLAKNPPSLLQRAKNFTKASINHIKNGAKQCSQEEKEYRFNICKSNKCGLFLIHDDNKGICAHDDCGCIIRSNGKFLDKLSWLDSKCPEGYW